MKLSKTTLKQIIEEEMFKLTNGFNELNPRYFRKQILIEKKITTNKEDSEEEDDEYDEE